MIISGTVATSHDNNSHDSVIQRRRRIADSRGGYCFAVCLQYKQTTLLGGAHSKIGGDVARSGPTLETPLTTML